MKLEEFIRLKEKAKSFQFNSFEYLDYESVINYEIIKETETLILIYGIDPDEGQNKVHWASNQVNVLVEEIKTLGKDILVSFIPSEWKEYFTSQGFHDYAIFREYWIADLNQIEDRTGSDYTLLTEKDCKAASEVTTSCRGQSRGFHGESESWIKEWISGNETGAKESGCKFCNILIHKINEELVGVACVAIYGFEGERGAILWLREIAVRPEYQGKGIGRKLIQQAIQYGKERGAKRAFLMADDCNQNAISLYKSEGFAPNDDVEINMIS